MNRWMTCTTLLAAALGGVACNASLAEAGRATEDFAYTYSLAPGGRVSVESFNGPIEVRGWDQDSVEIAGVKYANSDAALAGIKIEVDASESAVAARAVRPSSWRGNAGTRFVIRVPRQTRLERVATSNGALRVEEVEGDQTLATSNGGIRLRDLKGQISARTSNGSIEGDHLAGEVNVRTSNGRIELDHVDGGLDARTSNGRIKAALRAVPEGQPIRVATSQGGIDLRLEQHHANPVDVATSNGSITVELPETARVRIDARTSNGSIRSNLPLEVVEQGKHALAGNLNGGGPTVRLRTSNSGIRIERSF